MNPVREFLANQSRRQFFARSGHALGSAALATLFDGESTAHPLTTAGSAAAAGDDFETRPAMLVNGIGTVVAALLGSCFPTTIYIGHPGWKAMGARAAYSTINGIVIVLLCCTGGILLVLQVVPLEATLGILLWIGIINHDDFDRHSSGPCSLTHLHLLSLARRRQDRKYRDQHHQYDNANDQVSQ